MRGKGYAAKPQDVNQRITPAYAGKSVCTHCLTYCRGDHPRLCGEKQTVTNLLMANIGSPPPMRGKAFWGIHVVIRQGITPAYAGKSFRSDRPKATVQDHPRLCGEKGFREAVIF